MQVKCTIDNHRSTKKGLKITLHLDENAKKEAMQNLHNFEDMPLEVMFAIDAGEQKKRLNMISPEQRRKIYALFKDIAEFMGDNAEAVKINTKHLFCQNFDQEEFSLSDCSVELAKDFISFLIGWCFMHGVETTEKPKEILDDIEIYLWLCLKYKKCAVCGKPGEEHHVDAIGMGRDRKEYDDSGHLKICLDREHHTEAHQIGWQTFAKKYHVRGIIYNG